MADIPIVMSATGAVPTPPALLLAALIAAVAQTNPDYTANLPLSMLDDISGTDVAALVQCDSALIEFINSLTPYGANLFLLNQLGQIYIGQGFQQQAASNTSVFVVFTGTPGQFISAGFVVSDGVHQYAVQDNAIVESGGTSASVFCLALLPGSWAVPETTVTTIVTSLPSGVTLTVTNPSTGTPGGAAQTEGQYRAQVLQAGLSTAQGVPAFVKTQLQQVPGVQARLISMGPQSGGGWKVIVGGGDPYAVALAIFAGVGDISTLVGSTTTDRNITVSIQNYPDVYPIIFVNPPAATVTMTVTWNTTSTNVVSPTAVAQLAAPALVAYVNSVPVGAPLNLLQMEQAFLSAVANLFQNGAAVTTLTFAVNINGTLTPPVSGTDIIITDPEAFFLAASTAIAVVQG